MMHFFMICIRPEIFISVARLDPSFAKNGEIFKLATSVNFPAKIFYH